MKMRIFRIAAPVPVAAAICLAASTIFAAPANPQALLKKSSAAAERPGLATAQGEEVKATIAVAPAKAAPGKRLAVKVHLQVAPGWHIYGEPLPANYIPTTLRFDKKLVAEQSIKLPKAAPYTFKGIGETLPVYQGAVEASGSIVLKRDLKPGKYRIGGELRYQECNDMICKMPQSVAFEVPITVAAAH